MLVFLLILLFLFIKTTKNIIEKNFDLIKEFEALTKEYTELEEVNTAQGKDIELLIQAMYRAQIDANIRLWNTIKKGKGASLVD
jgi:hypothetical protein